MEALELVGIALSIWGSVFGLCGAWYTAQYSRDSRHLGFTFWLFNSPAIVLSLVGIGAGWWTGLSAYVFVPLNAIYWYTAYVGFKSTRFDMLNPNEELEEYQGA